MKRKNDYDIYAMGEDRNGYRTPDTLEDDFRFDKRDATRRMDDPYKRDRIRRMSQGSGQSRSPRRHHSISP